MVKTKSFALITIVIMMASVTMIAMPVHPVKAQLAASQPVSGPLPSGVTVNATAKTSAYLAFRPTLVGVGQTVLVNMWINPALASNNRLIPQGYVITITEQTETKTSER